MAQIVPSSARWEHVRSNDLLWSAFEHYHSGRVLKHPECHLDPQQTYLVGFHPHGMRSSNPSSCKLTVPSGIYPTTVMWATRGRLWREAFPGVQVDLAGTLLS